MINICIFEKSKLLNEAMKQSMKRFDDINIVEDILANKVDVCIVDAENIKTINMLLKKFPKTKIIVIYSDRFDENLLSLGINGFSYKNIDTFELYNGIKLVHNNSYWLDSNIGKKAVEMFKIQNNKKIKAQKVQSLTKRETQILRLITKGLSNPEIAEKLCISKHTAKVHVSNLLDKLDVEDRVQAAIIANDAGLNDEEEEKKEK